MKEKITLTLSKDSFLSLLDCVRSEIMSLNHDVDRLNNSTREELEQCSWISKDAELANEKLPNLVKAELELYGFGG